MKRSDSAVGAQSRMMTSKSPDLRYWLTYIMALSSSIPGKIAISCASTPERPVVRKMLVM